MCVPVLSASSMYSKVALQHEDPNDLQSAVLDADTSKFHEDSNDLQSALFLCLTSKYSVQNMSVNRKC